MAVRMYMRLAPLRSVELYWSDAFGLPFVKDTFPLYRFQQLCRYWHFSNNNSAAAKTDPYHKIRPMADAIKMASQSVYRPGARLSVDEAMFDYSGRSDLTVYMKDKPHPWGYKVWMLADALTFFVCDFNLYAPSKVGPEEGLTQTVVLDLVSRFAHTGRSVFMDNFYTSIVLFVRLHRMGLAAAGTVKGNRLGMPPAMRRQPKGGKQTDKTCHESKRPTTECRVTAHKHKESKRPMTERKRTGNECKEGKRSSDEKKTPKRQQGATSIVTSGVLTCTSWQDNKEVKMLSTITDATLMSTVLRWQGDGSRRVVSCPNVVKAYTLNMLGVDKHNQLREQYKARVRSKKWWVSLADDLIATATTNAHDVLYHNFGSNQLKHFEFLHDVARQLANGYSAWRHSAKKSQLDD
jgi:hypothetical protein